MRISDLGHTSLPEAVHGSRGWALHCAMLLGACLLLTLAAACSGGTNSKEVMLSVVQGDTTNQVAKGATSDMLAKATDMTGFAVKLPAEMPAKSRVVAMTITTAKPHKPDQTIALIDIEAASRHYLLEEYDGAYPSRVSVKTISGATVTRAWQAALDISRPGVEVYAIPSFRGTKDHPNQGYALIGKSRSYIIQATSSPADTKGEAALHTMVMSLPME